jgi:RNA polymerase sigma-70 factor (ECF subfamily)
MAALNRTYAVSKVHGAEKAIAEAEKLNLVNNHFYHVLLGELYQGVNRKKSREHFQIAYTMARTAAEKHVIKAKLDKL